ncbi:dihydrodipicolinate synthetase [Caballeronia sordidicola]|uniref:Dihydrodipicolinate synthetase n=1 Tax=Caballeronia sordidicola TaxID=196367 RepID=A0A158GW96_CABSO|nr:dihydrodipicolinate synthase family protein [Caballeronia sordidicola]SAL36193.1 dihydrodipicolinate synthetase [Caballeronia sordidicola]
MMTSFNAELPAQPLSGVFAPALTPFDSAGKIDQRVFTAHCRWLVDAGVGLAVFGTNSEAASLSLGERQDALEELIVSGLDPRRFMPGTGTCSVKETVELTRHALGLGVSGVLMLPPFYYPDPSEDGLFSYFADVIDTVADDRLRLYLYHIPQMTGVPITLGLIERLLKRYSGTVCGLKDSSGDWSNIEATIRAFSADGFSVFPASEALLAKALPLGAVGCISATANMNPFGLARYYQSLVTAPDAHAPDEAMTLAVRRVFSSMPMIPAMKYTLSQVTASPGWADVRPPLTSLSEQDRLTLDQALKEIGFQMEGLSAFV